MNKTINILIIEDNVDDAFLIKKLLERSGLIFQSKLVSDKSQFIDAISNETFDVLLSDNSLDQFNAKDVLDILKSKNQNIPVIIVSGTATKEFADAMIKEGAFDYVHKDNIDQIAASIQKATSGS